MSDKGHIDISGIDKAQLIAAMHAATHAQGMGYLHDTGAFTVEEAQAVIDENGGKVPYLDYLRGRVMKVDLSGDSFNPRLYDRDNFPGAAAKVVEKFCNGESE